MLSKLKSDEKQEWVYRRAQEKNKKKKKNERWKRRRIPVWSAWTENFKLLENETLVFDLLCARLFRCVKHSIRSVEVHLFIHFFSICFRAAVVADAFRYRSRTLTRAIHAPTKIENDEILMVLIYCCVENKVKPHWWDAKITSFFSHFSLFTQFYSVCVVVVVFFWRFLSIYTIITPWKLAYKKISN